jgi:hypothetical protein
MLNAADDDYYYLKFKFSCGYFSWFDDMVNGNYNSKLLQD